MNLEVAEERSVSAWLSHNKNLEDTEKQLSSMVTCIKRKIDQVHSDRRLKQEKGSIGLDKLLR